MSVTRHEDIVARLISHCTGAVNAQVIREEVLPQVVPVKGLANVRPEDAEEVERQLGTGRIEWQRRVDVEIVVQAQTQAARLAAFEAIVVAFGQRLTGETLDGVVDYIDLAPPEDAENLGFEGAATVKTAVLPIDLYYTTSFNPLEAST